ncbi:hypothetical protein K504DRAFT_90243 [Pleomassaria siparia CBS 279.74]|uniref:Uncharacterized protein n=1 Tax=Pleomassaria siparia CBS 279.74 TaxID=1314801 RepID=A0A6G1K0T6_9PLEO|nr:hypothetical protein K504DRAFT_90243 [Pleomassaria siparia CBS 279.74]
MFVPNPPRKRTPAGDTSATRGTTSIKDKTAHTGRNRDDETSLPDEARSKPRKHCSELPTPKEKKKKKKKNERKTPKKHNPRRQTLNIFSVIATFLRPSLYYTWLRIIVVVAAAAAAAAATVAFFFSYYVRRFVFKLLEWFLVAVVGHVVFSMLDLKYYHHGQTNDTLAPDVKDKEALLFTVCGCDVLVRIAGGGKRGLDVRLAMYVWKVMGWVGEWVGRGQKISGKAAKPCDDDDDDDDDLDDDLDLETKGEGKKPSRASPLPPPPRRPKKVRFPPPPRPRSPYTPKFSIPRSFHTIIHVVPSTKRGFFHHFYSGFSLFQPGLLLSPVLRFSSLEMRATILRIQIVQQFLRMIDDATNDLYTLLLDLTPNFHDGINGVGAFDHMSHATIQDPEALKSLAYRCGKLLYSRRGVVDAKLLGGWWHDPRLPSRLSERDVVELQRWVRLCLRCMVLKRAKLEMKFDHLQEENLDGRLRGKIGIDGLPRGVAERAKGSRRPGKKAEKRDEGKEGAVMYNEDAYSGTAGYLMGLCPDTVVEVGADFLTRPWKGSM